MPARTAETAHQGFAGGDGLGRVTTAEGLGEGLSVDGQDQVDFGHGAA